VFPDLPLQSIASFDMSAEASSSVETTAPAVESTPPPHATNVQQKLDTAKQYKETGDQAFKAGKVKEGMCRVLDASDEVK
jgi:hypothetical protein